MGEEEEKERLAEEEKQKRLEERKKKKEEALAAKSLPAGWEQVIDPSSGKAYYFNSPPVRQLGHHQVLLRLHHRCQLAGRKWLIHQVVRHTTSTAPPVRQLGHHRPLQRNLNRCQLAGRNQLIHQVVRLTTLSAPLVRRLGQHQPNLAQWRRQPAEAKQMKKCLR